MCVCGWMGSCGGWHDIVIDFVCAFLVVSIIIGLPVVYISVLESLQGSRFCCALVRDTLGMVSAGVC